MNNHLILSNVTSVDCAFVEKGLLVGHSFTPTFKVSGPLNGQEQVVIDFGTVKKRIKERIDHRETGWDHKLLWNPNQAYATTVHGMTTIDATGFKVTGAANAFQKTPYDNLATDILPVLARCLSDELGLEVAVAESGDTFPFLSTLKSLFPGMYLDYAPFRYTHGLAFSTSWGCQAIAHGHRSMVVAGTDSINYDFKRLVPAIVNLLDNAYIANSSYKKADNRVSYLSTSRGDFHIELNKPILFMPDEPTIENIMMYVVNKFRSQLLDCKVDMLAISEGVWKGACLTRKDWE